jgi:hypothetical protein
MDPAIYFTFFIGGLVLCVVGAIAWRAPTRPCQQCGRDISLQARSCRYCGYGADSA